MWPYFPIKFTFLVSRFTFHASASHARRFPMHVAFINPQGNFDPADSYWTAHPDFGGQLVYVKELALAMGRLGHHADIITRQITDPLWPEFAAPSDAYPGHPNVRILRIPCGPPAFLP